MTSSKEPPSTGPFTHLKYVENGHWVELTLARPEKLNALNLLLRNELIEALSACEVNDDIRAVILTGEGRAFCAGMDLHEFPQATNNSNTRTELSVFQILEQFPKPMIAAINGFAITGGFELALGCDILLVSSEAKFADTHASLGVLPGAGLSQKLSRILGLPKAMALHLTGDFLSAEDAVQYGLASHQVDPEFLLPLARDIAKKISTLDPSIAKDLKKLVRKGYAQSLDDGFMLESKMFAEWEMSGRREDVANQRSQVMKQNRNRF